MGEGVFSRDVALEFSGSRPIYIYKETRFLHMQNVQTEERERERERQKEIVRKSVLFFGGLLWNISVPRIKQLID